MNELWDVYDENGMPTGRVVPRAYSLPLPGGGYPLAVQIVITCPEGEFLVQKRSMRKKYLPGVWDLTFGSVVSSEPSAAAAQRETAEELGLTLPQECFTLLGRVKRQYSFIDVWHCKCEKEFPFVLQADEVDEVAWCSKTELLAHLAISETQQDDDYLQQFEELISHL